jgi:hypothetical protein
MRSLISSVASVSVCVCVRVVGGFNRKVQQQNNYEAFHLTTWSLARLNNKGAWIAKHCQASASHTRTNAYAIAYDEQY